VPDAMPVKVFGSSPRVTATGALAPIVTESTVVPAGTSVIGVASNVTEFVPVTTTAFVSLKMLLGLLPHPAVR